MLPPSLYKLRYRDFSTEAVSYNDIQKDLNGSFEINVNTIVQASSGVTLIPIAPPCRSLVISERHTGPEMSYPSAKRIRGQIGGPSCELGSQAWEAPFAGLRGGPPDPLFSVVVRAAAANVNPRTRLSHMTPFSGRDWCTRERCRPMMQNPQIFPEFPADDSQNFAASSEFPRIFRQSQTTPHTTPTHSPTPPLKPAACSTEARCVIH